MTTEEFPLPAAAAALIQSALPLLQDACSIGDPGDSVGRCIQLAVIQLEAVLASGAGLRGDTDHLDMLYDASSLLEAAAALQQKSGRSLILGVVVERLDQAVETLDTAQIGAVHPQGLPAVAGARSTTEMVTA